jgi:protein-tyrosine phosphatase
LLAAMPGRYGFFEEGSSAIVSNRVDIVVCLTPLEEVQSKSPDYARAMEAGELPWETRLFGIDDFGVPDDREAYLGLVQSVARDVEEGKCVLVHCGAGIGRTGTLAACVLVALGLDEEEALTSVRRAGGRPETTEQRQLVAWAATRLGRQ